MSSRRTGRARAGRHDAAARLAVLLLAVAVLMLPWLVYLAATLRADVHGRLWSSTWVGLDCFEILGLATTATLLLRRRAAVVVAASVTATLFLGDAWFDVLLSRPGDAREHAVLAAVFGEIPIALLCFYVASLGPALARDAVAAAARADARLAAFRRVGRRDGSVAWRSGSGRPPRRTVRRSARRPVRRSG